MSGENLISQVRFQVQQIDRLLVAYADLLDHARQRSPDLIELTAIGSVLHSFYNGIESIFIAIAKHDGGQMPAGSQWHRDLLIQMTQPTTNRAAVLSPDLGLKLSAYLGFRHFYRHSYSFFLEWGKLAALTGSLPGVWAEVKQSFTSFLDNDLPGSSTGSPRLDPGR